MLQIVQNYKTGELKLEEVPPPILKKGGAIVRSYYSLVSVGTERSTIEISKKSILGKAKERPDLVKQVIEKAKKIGIKNTIDLILTRLNTPVPLGYSLSGVVEAVSDDVTGIAVGDLVACGGAGYANHAEKVFVPSNLMAKVTEGVSAKEAAFTTVGSIALHGVRQADVGLGDRVGVIGLGLVGQLTVGLLKINGCKVFGIDLREYATNLSKEMGADVTLLGTDANLIDIIRDLTGAAGLDAVIITAGTNSNEPFLLSSEILRDRGKLVIVGGIRMEVVKSVSSNFYRKEIDIRFSRSYGPGRYDPEYEERGMSYPLGYVRWTENRNMQCFLELIASKQLCIAPLVTDIFPFEKATDAYKLIQEKNAKPYVGILFEYTTVRKPIPARIIVNDKIEPIPGKVGIGMIGAGKFAQSNILPYLKNNSDTILMGICTSQGLTARNVAERFSFRYCSHDASEIINDKDINAVFITTRHDSHAQYVVKTLSKGKHVYVEKPLCVERCELDKIIETYRALSKEHTLHLMVGYNRRFSPLSEKLKTFFKATSAPLTIIYRVNAGYIPEDNWYQDPSQGGRFIGEGCHFVDYSIFLTNSVPVTVSAFGTPCKEKSPKLNDNLTVTIEMANGSIATIIYNSSGATSLPKERVEVFGGSRSAILEDFKLLELFDGNKKKQIKYWNQEKGHKEEVNSYIALIKYGGKPLIPFEDLTATSLTTFAAVESLQKKETVRLETLCNQSEYPPK
ncbi:MAG: bi-domain-containing oxidoreductase [Sedimentisphaerales bacterium]|nr:bi-domain-containing oxidoreductase [Sedimentisphaerales bacterium]